MKQEDINTYNGIIPRRSPRIKTSLELNSIVKQEEEEIEVKVPNKRTLRSQMSSVSTHSKKLEPSNSLQERKGKTKQ